MNARAVNTRLYCCRVVVVGNVVIQYEQEYTTLAGDREICIGHGCGVDFLSGLVRVDFARFRYVYHPPVR